ncbi:PTS lactose/cellobiose transporter subunit IIA [Ligilactobacillus murinus]|uniref:PTS lactose/cellobiose transporter subunit IIA n=1 Tax=Ligilactobacillus murinus TaxID=1622 RepID=A0AAD0KZ84_9LACO|nr:PTS lactose/cellobiose transporter subunit IIA [Ligilactobacillus murinus]MDE7022999.1 PTS lactose/cellobiose transporter subunit IIA [Ligilactobacillus sp.]HBV48620.1 PTS lactose/cellobiose transporter subunit IIA [Lactobacillus sp.]AWZ39123.1 PTS lactose/cellobiose transporter subunit IIA [Ligilactobacillus murinus]AWZ40092.1 PTS lactose/cellobiose transporter subunit IIA [Ligilactobacillus murinus]MCR1891380.1 PTS lactose/cellobiose transporter subunit IIA [Ligilactobacillus murinus]
MDEKTLQAVMGLIMYGGDAKSCAMEALKAAKVGDFNAARAKLKQAKQELANAHNAQTEMLTNEAKGETVQMTLLTVHSQDHLMTGITFVDLAEELVELYEYIAQK